MVPVPKGDKYTLLAVIKDYILPGTIITSDGWRAYKCLGKEGFIKLEVDHSKYFKDPKTGAHTNKIERKWRDAKEHIPKYGRRAHHFLGYLAKFMFIFKFHSTSEAFHHFLNELARDYPVVYPGLPERPPRRSYHTAESGDEEDELPCKNPSNICA